MIAFPVNKTAWIASLVLSAIAIAYIGWVYSIVRKADQLKLIHIAVFDHNAYAASMANFEVKRRIKNGNENGVDALNYVLGFVDLETIDATEVLDYAESLLDLGVAVNGFSSSGKTALHDAISMNRPNAVRFLLEHCADPNALTSTKINQTEQKNAIELAYWAEKIIGGRQDFDQVFDLLNRRYPQCSR